MNARLVLAVAALALAFVGGSAHAATPIVVHSTAELVAAVDAANASAGADVITLAPGTYVLTSPLQPTGILELDGDGPATTVLDGNAAGRVIDASGADSLTISGLRITNGKELGGAGIFTAGATLTIADSTLDHNDASGGGSGGALLTNGPTTLENVTVSNNLAGAGGGIRAMSGDLTVIESTITHNDASGTNASGGGIGFHGGTLLLLDSDVSDNTVETSGGASVTQGGGVLAGGSHTVIDSTTISGNSITATLGATAFAGGLSAHNATITNSTISGNSADSLGGVFLTGRASVVNTTISDNVTNNAFQAGGLSINGTNTEIVDSTIADNLPTNLTTVNVRLKLFGTVLHIGATGTNCSGGGFPLDIRSGGYNVSSDSSCGLTGTGDVQNQDAQLAALQDGVRVPNNGSPVLGIVPSGFPPTDERGVFRSVAGADAGAVERSFSPVGVTLGMPATLLSGDTEYAILTLHNRSGAALTNASVAFDGTSRTIGSLADGASHVEIFQFTAPAATSCTDGSASYAFSATWNGTTQGGTFPAHVTAQCGGVKGRVTANGLAVAGGKVDVCLTTLGTCTEVTTNGSGDYEALVANGQYTVKAFPTASSPAAATVTTVGPVTVTAPAFATQDVALTPVAPPPSNVTVNTTVPAAQNGIPSVPKASGATVTFANPCAGSAPSGWTIAAGGTIVASGTFTGAAAPPFIFQATIPHGLTIPGGIGVFAAGCSSAPNPSPWHFRYYDPSGVVKDSGGNAVSGATVTLLRSDSASGPFTAVPNGSDVMSPENRRNPDTTLDDGSYEWDVTGGFYKVHAAKNGCTADSAVLTVPPPATGIDLTLACPAATTTTTTSTTPAPSGGGGGGAPAPPPAPPVVLPPAFVPPAAQAAPTVAGGPLHARRVKRLWVTSGSFTVDERSVLRLRLLGTTIDRASVVAGVRTGRPHAELVTNGSGRISVQLRSKARASRLEIVAVNGDGSTTRVVLPIR